MHSRAGKFARELYFAVVVTGALISTQGCSSAAAAAEFTAGGDPVLPSLVLKLDQGAQLSVKGTVTYGTTIRSRGRDPVLLPAPNAARVGATGSAPSGSNVDDGDLNYEKGAHVSTALKGLFDLELRHTEFRAFVRARAWDDYAQRRDTVPHGNLPGNYVANTPLSDGGFSAHGQFSGAVLMDAYIERAFKLGERPLMLRLGSQAIDWGRADASILGGLEQINAIDYAARFRAGALALQEGYIPVPAVFARWGSPIKTAVEAFYLLRFRENEQAGCGTFFALADYVTDGCDKIVAQPALTDPAAIAAGVFARRAPDVKPSHAGQYGIAVTHVVEDVGRFGVYFANYHSRRFAPSAIKSPRPAGVPPLIPGDPGGANVRYFIEYPEDIRVFGLNYAVRVPEGRWKGASGYAEYTYRPNQSVLLSSSDLFNAFASNVAPSQLRADASTTPPGAAYHGYDRRKISQFSVAASAPVGRVIGGTVGIGAEAGFKYIHDLPDVNVRRYVRSEVYGIGPVNGACLPGATSRQCSNEGYVTAFSWGYRAKASLKYTDVIGDVDLTPSLAFLQDVKGYSHDIIFIEGRKGATLAVRADIGRSFFLEGSWWPVWGGDYNFTKARDFYTLVGGLTF